MSDVCGYMIVTSNAEGAWNADWDGIVYVDRENALLELPNAQGDGGDEYARIVELRFLTNSQDDGKS